MTKSLLESFDPFAVHPFTNNSGLLPNPPRPSLYPLPIRSLPNCSSSQPPSPRSPSPDSFIPIQAPQPHNPSSALLGTFTPSPRKPIFVVFKPERSSPELEDILKKNTTSMIQRDSKVQKEDTCKPQTVTLPRPNPETCTSFGAHAIGPF